MTAAESTKLVQGFYDARGERAASDAVMSQDVVWDITPGFPYGGVYEGLDAVLTDFLGSTATIFSSMGARPDHFYTDDDGHVTVTGHYAATARNGQTAQVRFIHLWTITDGKISRLDQTADTAVVTRLLAGADEAGDV